LKVNGPDTHPLYRHLKAARRGVLGTKAIKWNFTKFLVGRDGRVAGRYGAYTRPEALAGRIEELLGQPEGV
jgi:glutathione peroxidase